MSKLLSNLKPPRGATKQRKRLGRGDSSGHGGTSGKGHKGLLARSGGKVKPGFEGGQMPLSRRLPKRGFTNIFRTKYAVINLADLANVPKGTIVDAAYLKTNRKLRQIKDGLKVLGQGELKVALQVVANKFSKTAMEKIEKAGGKATLVKQDS